MPLKLTVVSWNVHKCIGGLDRRYDPLRTATVLAAAQPDVVLLQEVAQNGSRFRMERQVDVLGDLACDGNEPCQVVQPAAFLSA